MGEGADSGAVFPAVVGQGHEPTALRRGARWSVVWKRGCPRRQAGPVGGWIHPCGRKRRDSVPGRASARSARFPVRRPVFYSTHPYLSSRSFRPATIPQPLVACVDRKRSAGIMRAMRTITTGLGLLESPRWHDGRLWVADWTAGVIRTVDGPGHSEVVLEHPSLPLCFDFLPDGVLVLASGPQRALLAMSTDGTLRRYADLSALSPYGSNDIVIDGRGNTYVNNVNFDFAAGPPPGDTAPGFVALATPDGQARVVAEDLAFPNGMAVTADNATLVVAESYGHRLTAFDIGADGSLSNRRVWAHLRDHSPDGICL